MPVTEEQKKKYFDFVLECMYDLGCFDFGGVQTVWHYTNGRGLLGILDSGALYATQVSCLNDSTEVRYASSLFRGALESLRTKSDGGAVETHIIDRALSYFQEDPTFAFGKLVWPTSAV